MKPAVEIYRLLPRTNCGKCGVASCFGFAAKLATRQAKTDDCPDLNDQSRITLLKDEQDYHVSPGTALEQTLQALMPRVAALDFSRAAAALELPLLKSDCLEVAFLNDRYTVTKECILDASGKEPEPFLSILIYNHLCMPDPPPVSGAWITFASVPASHAKDKAWAGHVEEVIAKHFSGNTEALKKTCERFGGRSVTIAGNHDAAYEFRFFPHYPVLLLFYDAVPDEDFPAQVKLLLDKNVDKYLDIESIVVLGEEFATRMTSS
ncbi:MAG TPA: DUF3786 domain-containing protein [Nitrospirota bacterium]|nr:DUF3786 domain-containing protein [Nitrospirota bacterium]